MKLRFDPFHIQCWAGKYCQQSFMPEEIKVMACADAIRQRGYLEPTELRQLAKWKSPRSACHVKKNDDNYVREITGFALHTSNERARIETLTLLDGVEWPTASAILHLYHPDRYPLLDFRALWSLQTEVPSAYKLDFWQRYTLACREIAGRAGVCMRTLDRALWMYSKGHQPKA